MGDLYRCDTCDREFILDEEPLSSNPKIIVPYCPYCGRKTKGQYGKDNYTTTVIFIRRE